MTVKSGLTAVMFFLAGLSQAQVISNFFFTKPEELKRFLDDRPEVCAFPGEGLIGTSARPADLMRERFTLIHFGSFDNTLSNHNLRVMEQIGRSFPEVCLIFVNNPKFKFPSETADVELLASLHGASVPIFNDPTFSFWECNGVEAWPTTLFVSPGGKVMDKTEGILDYRTLELALPRIIRLTSLTEKMNKTPMPPTAARAKGKKPLIEHPRGIAVNPEKEMLFVSDFSADRIWSLSPTGDVLFVIGSGASGDDDGSFSAATFNGPSGLAFDPARNVLYIADHKNHRIRMADMETREVTTLLGNGLTGDSAAFKVSGRSGALGFPEGLTLHENDLYISRSGAGQIWKCDLRTEVAERIAGTSQAGFADGPANLARLAQPWGMVMDKTGILFFTDGQSSSVRALESGKVRTVSGKGLFDFGYEDGKKDAIAFARPAGMCMYDEELYIADAFNHCIRVFDPFKLRSRTLAGGDGHGHKDGRGGSAQFFLPADVAHMNGILYIADAGNRSVRTFNLETKRTSTLGLINYGEIARTRTSVIDETEELDPISVGEGNNIIDIKINLAEAYEFDLSGFSNMAISSRNDTLFVRRDNVIEGEVTLDYQLEPDTRPNDLILDFHFYFREAETPRKQYYRGITYIIPVNFHEKGAVQSTISPAFDPDAVRGGPIIPEDGQLFME